MTSRIEGYKSRANICQKSLRNHLVKPEPIWVHPHDSTIVFFFRLKTTLRNYRCPPFSRCCPLICPSRCWSVHHTLSWSSSSQLHVAHVAEGAPARGAAAPPASCCRRGRIPCPRMLDLLESNRHTQHRPTSAKGGSSFGVVVHCFQSRVSRLEKSRPRLLPLPLAGAALEEATNHVPPGLSLTECSGVPNPWGKLLPPPPHGDVVRRSVLTPVLPVPKNA